VEQQPLPPLLARLNSLPIDDAEYLIEDKEAFSCGLHDNDDNNSNNDDGWASSGDEGDDFSTAKAQPASSTLSAFAPRIKMTPSNAKPLSVGASGSDDNTLSRRWNSAIRAVSMRRDHPDDLNLRGSVLKVAPPTLGERLRVGGGVPLVRRGSKPTSAVERTAAEVADNHPMARTISVRGDDYVRFMGETSPIAPVERVGPRWMPKSLQRMLMKRR
jgi:hypothetical protein